MRVTRVWKLRGIFWPTFARNFHVALWTICWIVGLCNIWHLTLLPADFECFVSYYSRFCAFCEPYSFNSSYYHINKPLRIYATLCRAWIIPEQNVSKIVKISQQMAKLWRKLKWLVFSGTRCSFMLVVMLSIHNVEFHYNVLYIIVPIFRCMLFCILESI